MSVPGLLRRRQQSKSRLALWSTTVSVFCLCSVLLLAGCTQQTPPTAPTSAAVPSVTFTDVTRQAGIQFIAANGAHGGKYLPETMGSGCAFLDYDNDGRQDILLLSGQPWPGDTSRGPVQTMHLYHNDGNGKFTDTTRAMGLATPMYGMGVAVGDYDNDGYDDIYVTGVGAGRLLHNEHGRRFVDVTARAGVASPGFASSATWVDYDRDGRLDLFVCHYVHWSPAENQYYSLDGIHQTYATPNQYKGESCRLYHNDGNGRFHDVSSAAGIYNAGSKALGVVAFDFDGDGWPDLFVSNDTQPNFLFHNQGDGKFKEVALETGVALSEQGKPRAGMGVDIGDDRGEGMFSVVVTNFAGEQLSLYRPDSYGHFLDYSAASGIGNASRFYLGFGVLFIDYDGDGIPDIFVANGHIQGDVETRQNGVAYREPALLMRNIGAGQYQDVTAASGEALEQNAVGRGAATGDFDNDGYPDILVTSNPGEPGTNRPGVDGAARLLRNVNHTGNHWLRLTLQGVRSNRDAYGARVRLHYAGRTQTQMVKASCSYLSQGDRRLLFGLGHATSVDRVEILWPSGVVQTLGSQGVDREVHVVEGRL